MVQVLIGTILLSAICLIGDIPTDAQSGTATTNERRQAELAWDALVRTKGGRERLRSISNFLLSYRDEAAPFSELQVLPDKVWNAVDVKNMPDAYMSDASQPIQYWATTSGVVAVEKTLPDSWYAVKRVVYLLETQVDKPIPVRVYRQKIDGTNLEVIETEFNGRRVDFAYEPEEMLVVQVIVYFPTNFSAQGIISTYRFSNYVTVGGIKMPQRESLSNGDEKRKSSRPIEFAFNVDYDAELFTRPLKATSIDAWKRKP
jgi:hypothetical protein